MDNKQSGNISKITKEWVEKTIGDFCNTELNSMHKNNEPAWGSPLVGYADGNDLLFTEISKQIGEFYWTAAQAFQLAYPDEPTSELTVISWILPQTAATKQDNRKQKQFPAERWALSRKHGEMFNNSLHEHLVQKISNEGILAVSPTHLPQYSMHSSEHFGLSSCWSHRHAAYVAGLGTFGLCDGLITERGKAMRCGSIIAAVKLDATPRPYNNPHAYCLYFKNGKCQACMNRCPANAVTPKGHNKELCRQYVFETTKDFVIQNYNIEIYGCGLCQTAVPCESSIPPACRPHQPCSNS